jgi:flagellar biosynthetic protein FlhB
VVQAFYSYFLRLVAPVLAVAFVAAFLGNLLQVGFLFSVKPITPDVNRILPNLGRFFRRALFSGEAPWPGQNIQKMAWYWSSPS